MVNGPADVQLFILWATIPIGGFVMLLLMIGSLFNGVGKCGICVPMQCFGSDDDGLEEAFLSNDSVAVSVASAQNSTVDSDAVDLDDKSDSSSEDAGL